MKSNKITGHLSAAITILIWGTTFISTKILLDSFQPIEILFFRFAIGLLALTIAFPKRLKGTDRKQELTLAAAGLCGITLYYLLENIALTYTAASNIGVIISTAPFFTAILSYFISNRKNKLPVSFFIGFIISMAGICFITFGTSKPEIKPAGDILALLAAVIWAFYSILTKKISSFGFNTILTTRRIFTYGIIFMLPMLFTSDLKWETEKFTAINNLLNLIFLGLGASGLCFVTWNYAVKNLGAVKTSVYIYMVPVITVTLSVIILKEQITPFAIIGTMLTLAGLLLSQIKINFKKGEKSNEP